MLLGRSFLVLLGINLLPVPAAATDPSRGLSAPDEFEAPALPPTRNVLVTDVPPAPGWVGYRTAFSVNVGLGSAVGEMGATIAFWPLPFLGTEVGAGTGFTGSQYSVMGKVAAGSASSASRFAARLGIAYADGSVRAPGHSFWLNLDIAGFETRLGRHLQFFCAGGVTYGLSGGKLQSTLMVESDCSPYPDCTYNAKVRGYLAPQVRTGFGAWF